MGLFGSVLHAIDSLIDMETQMAGMAQHPDFTEGL